MTHLASKICFFSGIIYVSWSSKAIKSNTQNLCIPPLNINRQLKIMYMEYTLPWHMGRVLEFQDGIAPKKILTSLHQDWFLIWKKIIEYIYHRKCLSYEQTNKPSVKSLLSKKLISNKVYMKCTGNILKI